jgi:hypothetical protein
VSKQIRQIALLIVIAGGGVFLALSGTPQQRVTTANVQISPSQFATYIREWSEPEGYFDTDNFISNETSYEHIIDELRSRVRPGGVYVGVGPDQNFTYIAHTHPSLAVIVDIRRQNMLQHLLYKALFEQAESRADYLALLFGKDKPVVRKGAGFEDLLTTVRGAPSSEESFRRDLGRVKTILTDKYKLNLSDEDFKKIEYTYRTFWRENLDLRFSSIGRNNAMQYPTFEELLLETDRNGRFQSFLSSDELFDWMKKFENENRLIPIVGDFGGNHAFRAVAKFLKDNGLQVSSFYTSNVEFYLFGSPSWVAFMSNVHALPVATDSVFIRAYFGTYGRVLPQSMPGHRSTTLVHGIVPFLNDYDTGKIPTYWEVVNRTK